jgi:hypothetical protein
VDTETEHDSATVVADIRAMTAWNLSSLAGCADPDRLDSEGAVFLIHVRDSVLELWEDGDYDRTDSQAWDYSGEVASIADNAPDVYTYTRWKEFVDLAAWQEEPEVTGEWPNDLTEAAAYALYQIADRLAWALLRLLTGEDTY